MVRRSVYIVCPSVLIGSNLKLHQTLEVKSIFYTRKHSDSVTFSPGLTLTGFRTTRPCMTLTVEYIAYSFERECLILNLCQLSFLKRIEHVLNFLRMISIRIYGSVCPVIDHEFLHNIVKVAVDLRGDRQCFVEVLCQ